MDHLVSKQTKYETRPATIHSPRHFSQNKQELTCIFQKKLQSKHYNLFSVVDSLYCGLINYFWCMGMYLFSKQWQQVCSTYLFVFDILQTCFFIVCGKSYLVPHKYKIKYVLTYKSLCCDFHIHSIAYLSRKTKLSSVYVAEKQYAYLKRLNSQAFYWNFLLYRNAL